MDLSAIHEALLSGFDKNSIAQMLTYRLQKNLEEISTSPRDLRDLAHQVVLAAQREGWLSDLVVAMKITNPDNPKVAELEEYEVSGGLNNLPVRIQEIANQLFELTAIVKGIGGLEDSGILAELRKINARLDEFAGDMKQLKGEVKRLDERVSSTSGTVPPKYLTERTARILAGVFLALTLASLFGGAISELWSALGG